MIRRRRRSAASLAPVSPPHLVPVAGGDRGVQRDVAGSGLGLAIVKRAVERANGTISLQSTPLGSRFIVQLPLA